MEELSCYCRIQVCHSSLLACCKEKPLGSYYGIQNLVKSRECLDFSCQHNCRLQGSGRHWNRAPRLATWLRRHALHLNLIRGIHMLTLDCHLDCSHWLCHRNLGTCWKRDCHTLACFLLVPHGHHLGFIRWLCHRHLSSSRNCNSNHLACFCLVHQGRRLDSYWAHQGDLGSILGLSLTEPFQAEQA